VYEILRMENKVEVWGQSLQPPEANGGSGHGRSQPNRARGRKKFQVRPNIYHLF